MNYLFQLASIKAAVPKAKRRRKPKVTCSVSRNSASRIDYSGYDWRLPIVIA